MLISCQPKACNFLDIVKKRVEGTPQPVEVSGYYFNGFVSSLLATQMSIGV